MKNKICEVCKNNFLVDNCRYDKARFCSQDCKYKGIFNQEWLKKRKEAQITLWQNKYYRDHMRKAHIGQKAWNKNVPLSEIMDNETREKRKKSISQTLKGKYASGERKPANLGKKHTKEHKRKISLGLKGKQAGEKNWNWQGGKVKENEKARRTLDYKFWRLAVFERDNYTCRKCGKQGERLNAHHIKEFSKYPELRYNVENGLTLCENKCHKGVHKCQKLSRVQ